MSRAGKAATDLGKGLEEILRHHRAPRQGVLVLVCEKCERRLEGKGRGPLGVEIAGALEEQAAEGTETGPVRLERVGCMKLCPDDGVTVCALRAREFRWPEPIEVHDAEEVGVFFGVEVTGEIEVTGRR